MNPQQQLYQFPPELLRASKKDRLAYYDDYMMGHPYLDEAFEMLKTIIHEHGESRLVFIFGPTGAGKTTVRLLAEKWVIEQFFPVLKTDKGFVPVSSVEAVIPKSGLFNVKDHLKRSLRALHEPEELINYKINYGVKGVYCDTTGELVIQPRIVESELGWALEQALKHRRPRIFFIDEAHHLLAVASGRKLTDVPEAIKSLANRTGILHGLLGTYELLTLHDVGDQLSRRSIYIHLPRYNAEYMEDRDIWQGIVWNFQLNVPVPEIPDFLSHWEYLYERSLGCVGIIKNWTRNALADALEENAKTVSLKHLEKRALSVGQCQNIFKYIKEGEKRYAEIEGDVQKLRGELGLDIEPISRKEAKLRPYQKILQGRQPSHQAKRNVGKRKPQRDPIGREKNAEN